jgi:hypothetical protein
VSSKNTSLTQTEFVSAMKPQNMLSITATHLIVSKNSMRNVRPISKKKTSTKMGLLRLAVLYILAPSLSLTILVMNILICNTRRYKVCY